MNQGAYKYQLQSSNGLGYQVMLISKDRGHINENEWSYYKTKSILINGVDGKFAFERCEVDYPCLKIQILEWIQLDTRIEIRLYPQYELKDIGGVSDAELIKIAESMVPVNTEKIPK